MSGREQTPAEAWEELRRKILETVEPALARLTDGLARALERINRRLR